MTGAPIHSYLLRDHLLYPHLPFHIQPARHYQDFHNHRHDFTELTLVVEGRGTHHVSGHAYPIAHGNVFAVHPGLCHSFTGTDRLRIINIMFSWETPLMDTKFICGLPGFHQLFTLDPLLRDAGVYKPGLALEGERWDDILGQAYQMIGEYNRGEPGCEGMIHAAFQKMIITLSRDGREDQEERPEETRPIARAMAYLQQHYRERITAEELADAACVSSRHLARLFATLLNTSPFEYLADLRLSEAHRRLAEKGGTITEIAESCGFSDSNYFSQVFKKRYGASPREYRKTERREL